MNVKRWEVSKWLQSIHQHGLRKSLYRWWNYGTDIKTGRLVGTDSVGNKFYENLESENIFGRDRWVDYARTQYPSEPSQISPEWHAWMHRMTDFPPTSPQGPRYFPPRARYQVPVHYDNRTGTDQAYRPYNTTKAKMESWVPEVKSRQ